MNHFNANIIALPLLFSSPLLHASDMDFARYFSTQNSQTPGCAVGVIQSNQLIEQHYVGQSNIRYQVPIDEKTVFDIASVSKHMTAYIIMGLESEGLLSRNQTLFDFYKDGPEWFKEVTLFHLLTHQSGIPDYLNDEKTARYFFQKLTDNTTEIDNALWGVMIGKDFLLSEVIDYSKQLKHPTFTPGTSISYSNTGYVLLAAIIEQVSHNSFEQEVDTRIFKPLRMNHSYVSTKDDFNIDWKATGYFIDKMGNYAYNHTMLVSLGDGGIQATLPDMAKWIGHLIEPKFEDKSRDKLLDFSKGEYPVFTPYWGVNEFRMGDSKYVNGLIANNLYNGEFYTHSGYALDDMVTEFWFSPDRKLGYIQMCNYPYFRIPPMNKVVQHYIIPPK